MTHGITVGNGTGAGITIVAAALLSFAAGTMARAEIDNEATAQGQHGGQTVTSPPVSRSVPVAEPNPALSVTLETPVHGDTDNDGGYSEGDTITFRFTVTNTGNIPLYDVAPGEMVPQFAGQAGENTVSQPALESASDDLQPGESASYSGEYALTRTDIYRAAGIVGGVTASATALGLRSDTGEIYASGQTDTVSLAIAANPALRLDKSYEFTRDEGEPGKADPGDVILYTYRVTNAGNVAIDDVTINDVHEGAPVGDGLIIEQSGPAGGTDVLQVSSDAEAGDGVWDVLGAGATIVFTYEHTVTRAEFDAQ